MATRPQIGVRELRQNASKALRRVEAGETLEVTSRGEPVALLTPIPERTGLRERLIAEGKLIPGKGRLEDIGPPPPVSGLKMSVSEALAELREEEDR
ncbi:MAG: type II toxin-antitoxin system Phd/YefM family antitoxin [Solirubrobacterales bacterium]